MTTVGYGDIAPRSEVGRAIVCFMLIFLIATLPVQIDKLLRLLRQRESTTFASS